MKVCIIACEPSGDLLGEGLIKEMMDIKQNTQFFGIGGPRMLSVGQNQLNVYQDLMIMGFWEVIKHLPKILLCTMRKTLNYIKEIEPDVIITIDSPGFNFSLIKRVRKLIKKGAISNAKIIHYVAPSVWAYGENRKYKVSSLYDHIMLLFPFETRYFKHMPSTFVGHPICEMYSSYSDITKDVISIFPGSRSQEIEMHMPTLIDFINKSVNLADYKDCIFVFHALLHTKEKILGILKKYLKIESHVLDERIRIATDSNEKEAFLSRSKFAVVKSGTVTLEIAARGIPMVVFYKVSKITEFIVTRKINIKWICILNIIAQREVVKELIQDDFNADNIIKYLHNCKENYRDVIEQLKGDVLPSRSAAMCVMREYNN